MPSESTLSRWLSGHLFDHGDRDLLLTGMVGPTVAALFDERRIDSFFFLRSDLGGPRLRLLAAQTWGMAGSAAELSRRWPEMLYSEAARRFRREIATAPPDVRARILKSQMHMTANRLGLSNPEEVHTSRLLQRAALSKLLPGAFTTWLHA